jgi:phosphomevalonate kinase
MLIARAPGKIVLSGAYAVLNGAPGVAAAVDRYVIANPAQPAEFVTPEVQAALGPSERAPHFDARALRDNGNKLGLGSSAAILVASLAAIELDAQGVLDDRVLRDAVFERALRAHRQAQGGGSGIDVAASTYGGVLIAKKLGGRLELEPTALPAELHLCVLASGEPAVTSELLRLVERLRERNAELYEALMAAQSSASVHAARAIACGDRLALVRALSAQHAALAALGGAAGASVVTPPVAELHLAAQAEGAAVLPAGAGGGDIAFFAGAHAPSPAFLEEAERLGHRPLDVRIGARGVHAVQRSRPGSMERRTETG